MHPDFILLQPEEEGKAIKVDQVRSIIDKLYQSSHTTASATSEFKCNKIIIIAPAESMSTAAANALLKSLEEPPQAKTLLMLVSHQPAHLLATIRSRCQSILFHPPAKALVQQWLAEQEQTIPELLRVFADNAPLHMLTLAGTTQGEYGYEILNDLVTLLHSPDELCDVANKWAKGELTSILHWLFLWLQMLLYKHFLLSTTLQLDESVCKQLTIITNKVSKIQLFTFLDYLIECKKMQKKNVNLQQQLQLEALFYRWVEFS
jgi:DNA polymerase-3 subunit delta'